MVKGLVTHAPAGALAVAVVLVLVAASVVLSASPSEAFVGSISGSIEIDANLYPGGSTVTCAAAGATLPAGTDWVKDCQANTDQATLVDSIATGIQPGVTGRVGGFGHW